ncbi:MAG TPA: transcription termination factor NusA, partial [bacterium]|nr:transcription termination factor NusA [bacterium]
MSTQFNEEEFFAAIDLICDEKKLSKEKVMETIEAALAVAYRKDYGRPQMEIKAKIGPGGLDDVSFSIVKEVIADDEEIKDELTQIHLSDAQKVDPEVEIEGKVCFDAAPPENFGRIAAQTAKQVVIQRLREAERETIFEEYKDKVGQILSGIIQRIEGQNVYVDLGAAVGVIYPTGRVPGERYAIGQRLKLLLESVDNTSKGAQILLTRSSSEFIKQLFTMEIPEIDLGSVEIKSVAREAGVRSKVAVSTNQEGVDPIGSCVGQKGTRVQAVINEVGSEKIDIVLWDENPVVFIKNALAPAKIAKVVANKDNKQATIYVEADQQSLAIGKNGQNVKLASRLVNWKLDIIEASKEVLDKLSQSDNSANDTSTKPTKEQPTQPDTNEVADAAIDRQEIPHISVLKLSAKITNNLLTAGY